MAKCVACGGKGLFLKVDKQGLCAPCAPKVAAEIERHCGVIYEEMHVFERSQAKDEKLRALDAILAAAQALLPWDEKGLETCSPPPALVLDEYRGFREDVAREP